MCTLLTIVTILSSFLANLETKTLQADFTVSVSEQVNAPMNYPGKITMQGNRFLLTMFGIEAAYDGKTMYMYSGDTDELTLTNPTEQELVETNPFLYAKALTDVCNITEKASQDGKQTIVTLTPKNINGKMVNDKMVNRFTLTVRNADLIPLQAEIKESKKTTTLKLKEPKFINTKIDYIIKPDKDTYVNDMRL
jgi:outer membrane lipoprotein-sorting protein